MNKRNFLKVLSATILGTLTVGNCSNVWMMEGYKSKETIQERIFKNKILEKLREQAENNTNLKNFNLEELANKLSYALVNEGKYIGDKCANMAVKILSDQIKVIKNVNIDNVIYFTVNSLLIKHVNYLINKWDNID